jgi:antitoxin PrlF
MATRITIKGQVTIPKKVREALHLAPGDGVEFRPNANGEFVVQKAHAAPPALRPARVPQPRSEAQERRRAAALLALLRGLD